MQLVQAVAHCLGQCLDVVVLPAFNQVGHQVVTEFALGPDHRLVEAVVTQAAVVVYLQIADQRQAFHLGHQRAQAGADAVRQHRQWLAGKVDGGGAVEGLLLGRAVGCNHRRRVGNGDGEGPAGGVGFGQQGVVHVLGARAVDGHVGPVGAVFAPGFPGFDVAVGQAVGLLLHGFRPGIGQIKGGQGKGAFNARGPGLANHPKHLGLALAVLDRMLVNLAVNVVIRLGIHPLFGRNEDPAVDARSFRDHEVTLAFYQVTAHKGVQAGFQQFVHHALGFAFLHFLLGDVHPVAWQDLLHFLRGQEHIPALIERDKPEAAIGGFDGAGKDHLVFLDIGFQLAQLAESVGIEHEVTWLLKMNDGAEYNGYGPMRQIAECPNQISAQNRCRLASDLVSRSNSAVLPSRSNSFRRAVSRSNSTSRWAGSRMVL